MTLEELQGELKALLDFKAWLEEKLLAVEIDIAGNEQEQEDILNDMQRDSKHKDTCRGICCGGCV